MVGDLCEAGPKGLSFGNGIDCVVWNSGVHILNKYSGTRHVNACGHEKYSQCSLVLLTFNLKEKNYRLYG
jgi:hypothetical protein